MKLLTLPNILSMLRLVAAPLLALVFWLPSWTPIERDTANMIALVVFLLAAATDFVDGYLARKLNKQTALGKFLDPVADKILVITALLLLLEAGRAAGGACLLIIIREIFVSALREWAALFGHSETVKVSSLGKWKTALQMGAVGCLIAGDSFAINAQMAGILFLWLAAALAVWSMGNYCWAAWKIYSRPNR
ncbi:MAG: CDP-diacylglycerol--glycerol-3-phosphate 3-phosphatidyltransferase [Gammaproteobacteria bacterium WSBS_2016_MAG_OTU1]